jgi:hypothetical protein
LVGYGSAVEELFGLPCMCGKYLTRLRTYICIYALVMRGIIDQSGLMTYAVIYDGEVTDGAEI